MASKKTPSKSSKGSTPAAAKPAKTAKAAKPSPTAKASKARSPKPRATKGKATKGKRQELEFVSVTVSDADAVAAQLAAEQDLAEAEAQVEAHGGLHAHDEAPTNGHASHASVATSADVDEEQADHDDVETLRIDGDASPEADATTALPYAPEAPSVQRSAGLHLSLPEETLLVAMGQGWDDRAERLGQGRAGAALVGSLLLELALKGRLAIQRDRFTVVGDATGDAELEAFAAEVAKVSNLPAQGAMVALGRKASRRVGPWKERLHRKGLVAYRAWRHLGVFRRSEMRLADSDAQTKLVNRLTRTLAGGGVADAQTVCLLGILEASGILETLVPASTMQFNRRRLTGLITGKDPMGYRVDRQLRSVSDIVLRTVIENVKLLTR